MLLNQLCLGKVEVSEYPTPPPSPPLEHSWLITPPPCFNPGIVYKLIFFIEFVLCCLRIFFMQIILNQCLFIFDVFFCRFKKGQVSCAELNIFTHAFNESIGLIMFLVQLNFIAF